MPASLADLVAGSALASPPLRPMEHGAEATEEAGAAPTLAALVSDRLGDPLASLSYLNDDGIAPAMLGFAKVAAAASRGQGDRALAARKAPKQAWGRPLAATALQVQPVLNAATAPERAGGDDSEPRYRFTLLTPTDASEAPDAAATAPPTGQVAPPVPTSRAPAARRFQQQAALAPSPRSPGTTTGLTPPVRTRASRATALRVVGLRLALPPTAARRPFDANELEIGLMPGSKADRLANFLEGVSRGDSAGERSRDMWNFSFAEIVNGWARAGRHGELTLDRVARGTISRHEQARRRDMVRTLRKLDGSGNFAF